MARSSSHRSHTRPQGLWGEQNTAAWMRLSTIFFSMPAKSIRHTPPPSSTRGLWTISYPLLPNAPVKPM